MVAGNLHLRLGLVAFFLPSTLSTYSLLGVQTSKYGRGEEIY